MGELSENCFSDENWNSEETLLEEIFRKIFNSLQCPSNDFIPRDYQSDLADSSTKSNKILFLPYYRDKLFTSAIILKSLYSEIEKNEKKIVYLSDSTKSINSTAIFFNKHFHYNTVTITENSDESYEGNNAKGVQIIITSSAMYLNALSKWHTRPADAFLMFIEDCSYGYGEHSMKQIMNFFHHVPKNDRPKIVAYTSCFLHREIEADNIFAYLKNMEITFDSVIACSQYCDVIRKLLPRVNIKFVKYQAYRKSLRDVVHRFSLFENVIGKAISTVESLKLTDKSSSISLKDTISRIFYDIFRYLRQYGPYPAFVVTGIYRIKLEKMKFLKNTSSSFFLSAVITDLCVLRSLIYKNIRSNGNQTLSCANVIVQNSCEKIIKLLSLLHKKNLQHNYVIFVDNCITARMITFILQELSGKLSHMVADFIIKGESVYDADYDREKFLFEKRLKDITQKFQERLIDVLVVSWDSDMEFNGLSSDWIIYFDMPPSYEKYISSRKLSTENINSNFFFLEQTENQTKFNANKNLLNEFVKLDLALKELALKKDITDEDRFHKSLKVKESEFELNQKFSPLITKYECVTFSAAINIFNKYCKSLPCDGFSSPAPRWSFSKKENGVVCRLQFPMQSGIHTIIENLPIKNVKFVKQIVALEAIKFLYERGQLNENMQSTFSNVEEELNNRELFPNWKEENEIIKPGSANCFRTVPLKFPEWFNNCCPQPNEECYIHVFHLRTAYEEPEDSRKLFFHKLMQSKEEEFGILTSKKLPQVCKFPVYSDLGEINVKVDVNVSILKLTEEQIEKLQKFHRFIFLDVLQIVNGFLVADYSNGDNSYCIAPLKISDNGDVTIAWDVVYNHSFKQDIIEPSEEERVMTNYNPSDYLGKVVTPWYRMLSQKYYIITRVCKATPSTPFPSGDYDTFTDYYEAKYSLEVKQPIQPLLEARIITENLKCVRPRAQNPGVKKKKGEKEHDHKVILLPEFCIRQPFPAVYWYKSILILAITHRLHYILLAEELRREIAFEFNENVNYLQEDDILLADESYVNECEETVKPVVPLLSILKQIKLIKNLRRYPWGDEQLPIDMERHLNNVSTVEIMSYCDFMKTSTTNKLPHTFPAYGALEFEELKFYGIHKELYPGPKQSDILQAFIGPKCDDIINLERFKLFGKSFLNFSTSFYLYQLYPKLNVLQLRRLKNKIKSKRNLYYCGAKLQLGSYLTLHDFSENNDWFLSGFNVPKLFINILEKSFIPPDVIFNLEVPKEQQYTGVITPETRNTVQEKMIDYYNKTTKTNENVLFESSISDNCDHNHAFIYLKKHSVPDKAIVNALKSLTGIYLENTGVKTTFQFLQFVGVFKHASFDQFNSPDLVIDEKYSHSGFGELEMILEYEFNDKKLLLEALTHHSYFHDAPLDCNYKLAFLGESVLDLLITGYVHENFKSLKISEVRELRIALMNDIIFATVVARLGLHKFLLLDSIKLMEKIDQFVGEEKMVDYEIHGEELLFLIEETSSVVIDSVDVPRALADLFKAIVAAIFLDCKGDLRTVWRVLYRLLKNEINKFIKILPRDPIALLSETSLKFAFGNPVTYGKSSNLIIIPLEIDIDDNKDNKKVFFGIGSSKNQAKRVAAKIAFKELTRELVL